LLPSFTVVENVAMPFFRICGQVGSQERTLAALEFVGIAELHAISVGDLPDLVQWRVAFARAIVHSPPVLIAVSPPNPILLPYARRLADECGTTVLWNGDKSDLLPFSDHLVEVISVLH
jgi:ABC-type ATPase involved in cell division